MVENKKIPKKVQEMYTQLLDVRGREGLYKWAIGQGILRADAVLCPDVEMLDLADSFFALSRSSGDKKLFIIGQILRKSAHKIFRSLEKVNPERPLSTRFLKSVSS